MLISLSREAYAIIGNHALLCYITRLDEILVTQLFWVLEHKFECWDRYHCFLHGCLALSQNITEAKIWRQKISLIKAFEACLSSDKFEAYLAETLRSLCFVMLFVMRKGIHECNTKRNNIYMPSNLFSFLHVTTATNTFCVKRECNHGFAPLNCDFEKNKAAVGVFYNVVQFWVLLRRLRLKIELHFR